MLVKWTQWRELEICVEFMSVAKGLLSFHVSLPVPSDASLHPTLSPLALLWHRLSLQSHWVPQHFFRPAASPPLDLSAATSAHTPDTTVPRQAPPADPDGGCGQPG